MKKLFALILTVAMLATMSVTAFATEINQDAAEPQQGEVAVHYEVAPTYTVTIPATVTLGETAKIQVENVVVVKGKQVEVALTNANGFKVSTDEGAELTYTVKNGEAEVAEGDTVLAVNPADGTAGETTLNFVAPADIRYAGKYKGTVIFTVAVKEVPKVMINFTIDGTPYQAEPGMTWAEWIASECDSGEFKMSETVGGIWIGSMLVCAPGATGWQDYVSHDDVIQADYAYVLHANYDI